MPPPKYLDQANRLIASFPAEQRASFVEHCEVVDLQRQDVLAQAGQPVGHVYFPIDSFVANVFYLADGHFLQVGLVGNEGMTHASVALGQKVASMTSVVQGAGRAFRIQHRDLHALLCANSILCGVLYKYAALFITQLARNMACASHHSVKQRLARWLLATRDCLHSSELPLTHDVLASMLGVRRERVTPVASAMQRDGLISYSRGNVSLLNETGLRVVACGCYQNNLAALKPEGELAHTELFVF